jgi:hypothetical protein
MGGDGSSPLQVLYLDCTHNIENCFRILIIRAGMVPTVTVTDWYVIIRHSDLAARLKIFRCMKYS